MKKLWVDLVAVLLFAALTMTCASAEADEEIILGDGSGAELQLETSDGIVMDNEALSLDIPELSDLEETDILSFDISRKNTEPDTNPAYNAIESSNEAEDFEIINGILVKYNGPGGDVVIPDGVTTIGEGAFYDCDNLTNIAIPNSVTSIRDYVFYDCDSLTNIAIPNSIINMGAYTFCCCSNLASVTIPDSITSIGLRAFSGCDSLCSVTIPNSITSIGMYAFSGSNLTGIIIPNSVTSIDYGAFSDCSSLANITIGNGLHRINYETFDGCVHLESIVLPANISSISKSAFNDCYSLMDVTLLNGTTDIDDEAFSGCPTTMTFHTPCDSATTKWAEGKGYTVVKSDHTPVTDPASEPTCTKDGKAEGSHCSVCKAIIKAQETIPATGHTPVTDPAVAPTCTKTGLTEGSHCSVCGEILVKQQTVPKLISVKKCKITSIKDAVYTGKPIQPAPVVKYNGKKLVKGTDYTVKYAANKAVGIARVTISGVGKYGESVSKTFTINPKAVALTGLTAGKQQLTVKWKKGTGVTGYEVQYGLKKSFAGAKTVAVKKTAVKTVLKKLTAGKTYYVRIRAYKTVKGKKYYSAWSKAKSAKVK